MTRKDYELIAKALKAAKAKIREVEAPVAKDDLCDGVDYARDYIAALLQEDNPRFDAERFAQAVGK